MAKEIEQLDNEKLTLKLKEWLESAPLYTEYRYTGGNLLKLPDDVELFCEQCEKKTPWKNQVNRTQFPSDRMPLTQRSYRCKNCKEQFTHFAYSWFDEPQKHDGKAVSVFRKYGQLPPLEERISKELERALKATDDLGFYKTALRSRNFGEGIGAMAYMRRIIENHMSEMLEILNNEAVAKGLQPIKEEIKSLRFDEKIDRAKELFPVIVMPENYPNPFEQLYRLTSDGLHNLSENESIMLFDQCRHVFEYVFSEMRPHLSTRKKFLEDLQKLPKLGSSALEKQAQAAKGEEKNAEAQKAS
jgi:hypothetical protein